MSKDKVPTPGAGSEGICFVSYIEMAQFISIKIALLHAKCSQIFRKTIYVKLSTLDFEYLRLERSAAVCFGSRSRRKRPIATEVVFLILQRDISHRFRVGAGFLPISFFLSPKLYKRVYQFVE